jgi:hypothetical protein
MFWIVGESSLRADKNLSEEILIEGEGDAIGRGWVLKMVGVKLGDPFLRDEVDRDLLTDDIFLLEEKLNELLHRRNFNRQVGLAVVDVYATAGVLGSPVTFVFSPSFHLPTLRNTSMRS